MGKIAIVILSVIAIFSCSAEDAEMESAVFSETGILVDMSKFDGCGWVFKYDNNTLEPYNLSRFDITPVDSMPVGIRYLKVENQNSTCMLGTVISLVEIWKIPED